MRRTRAIEMTSNLLESDLSGGVIKIDVGASKTPFDVHLELLCACSPYFESLFQHRFEQVISEQIISFPDDNPQIFAQVILWMYRGNRSMEMLECKKMDFLVPLWILAGKLEMGDLQNSVMLACKAKADELPKGVLSQEIIKDIYSHTLPRSPMRCFAVDIWMRRATTERFEKGQDELPRSFLEDLCREFIEERKDLKLPTTLPVNPEDRYFTRLSPLASRNEEARPPRGGTELRCAASDTQMESRKIKIPSSRTKSPSAMPASIFASIEAGINQETDLIESSNEVSKITSKTD